jgi:hypothetical protein
MLLELDERTRLSCGAGLAFMATCTSIVAAGLYQRTLSNYLNVDIQFSAGVDVQLEDANADRGPGFLALVGSFGCFLFVTVNLLFTRAELISVECEVPDDVVKGGDALEWDDENKVTKSAITVSAM